MPPEGIPVTILAIVWAIRELVPLIVKAVREHRSKRPPPAPPPRSELPTPTYESAARSGPFHALGPLGEPQLATRSEVAELAAEMRDLHGDVCRRLDMLSRDVGRLEGAIAHAAPRPPRPGR